MERLFPPHVSLLGPDVPFEKGEDVVAENASQPRLELRQCGSAKRGEIAMSLEECLLHDIGLAAALAAGAHQLGCRQQNEIVAMTIE